MGQADPAEQVFAPGPMLQPGTWYEFEIEVTAV
jgi:hypothetical protein